MAIKWADYLISKVRYDYDKSYITDLFVHKDNGDNVGAGQILSRERVIRLILGGTSFNTIYANNGKWINGAEVRIISVGDKKYLRTDSNRIKKDNLGELPEF